MIGSRLARMARLAPLALAQQRFPFRDRPAIERAQSRRVARIVVHAYEHVPHYREEMDRLGLKPDDLKSAAALARLPLIERELIQGDPERLTSRSLGEDRIELHSSGTSGAPITTAWDRAGIFAHLAYRERQRAVVTSIVGRRFGYRETSFSLLIGTPTKIYEERTKGLVLPRFLIDRQNLSMLEGPAANLAEMREFDPHVIRTFGSYLESLFLELERSGASPPSLRIAEFSGDSISEPARRRIEERFSIPVIGVYNAHETLDIAFECEHHRGYHLNTDLCPVRIVDSDGRDLPDGEVGEVVVSNLVNRGTVLLNYRLGDRAARLSGDCPCGRNLPLLELEHGRITPWLATANGTRVSGLLIRAIVMEDPEVRQFRVVQATGSQVEVSVVSSEGADREPLRRRLGERLSAALGDGATVDVRFLEHIPPGPSGKRQEVIVSSGAAGESGPARKLAPMADEATDAMTRMP